jgi:hypothetical protein
MLDGILIGEIEIPMKLKNNNQGQGRHWSGSHKERLEASQAVAEARVWQPATKESRTWKSLPEWTRKLHFGKDEKLGLVVWRILGKRERLWDADSVLRGNYKQIQDALIEAGLAEDDSPKYIEWVLGRQDDSIREQGPKVLVEVYRVPFNSAFNERV